MYKVHHQTAVPAEKKIEQQIAFIHAMRREVNGMSYGVILHSELMHSCVLFLECISYTDDDTHIFLT